MAAARTGRSARAQNLWLLLLGRSEARAHRSNLDPPGRRLRSPRRRGHAALRRSRSGKTRAARNPRRARRACVWLPARRRAQAILHSRPQAGQARRAVAGGSGAVLACRSVARAFAIRFERRVAAEREVSRAAPDTGRSKTRNLGRAGRKTNASSALRLS